MTNREIVILVGCPGSGKSTLAKEYYNKGYLTVSQDELGREGHLALFNDAINCGRDIVIDRMNFNKSQRARYLKPATDAGYKTTIITLYVASDKCMQRCLERKDHPTIKTEQDAESAIGMFFRLYEPVSLDEAENVVRMDDKVEMKRRAILCDIDGTIADTTHRQHFVQGDKKKRDWKSFFSNMIEDPLKKDVAELVDNYYFNMGHSVIMCSGRPDDHRAVTKDWLSKHNVVHTKLLMRRKGDFRRDDIVKQIIYEFDIRPYYDVKFVLDDRDQVVKMWREQGLTCLQVDYGAF